MTDTQKVERTDHGASVRAKLKRGEGTRDQDEFVLKGKGATADEAIAEFEQLLAKYEDEWADDVRAIQPTESDGS